MALPDGFRRFLRGPPADPRHDIEAELESHLEMRTRDLVDVGLREAEARTEAERRFGDVGSIRRRCERLQSRLAHRMVRRDWLGSFAQDLRFGIRALAKRPGFAALAVLTLGLAIGANTAVFTVVEAVLLRPLPFAEPGRLLALDETSPTFPVMWVRRRNFDAWRERSTVLAGVATHLPDTLVLSGGPEPLLVPAARVTSDLFAVLGVAPLLGRTFQPEEERPGEDAVVILSHDFWTQHLGADPAALGQTLVLDDRGREIVGVMGPEFEFPIPVKKPGEGPTAPVADLWVPLVNGPGSFPYATARLRSGVTVDQAVQELDGLMQALVEQYPTNRSFGTRAQSLLDYAVGPVRPGLLLVAGAVALVLLIASLNVSAMLLSRAIERRREIELRLTLGAGRRRILRQLLTEGSLLACAAVVLGVALARAGVPVLLRFSPPELPRIQHAALSPLALAYALSLTALSVVLSSLLPAFRASRAGTAAALRSSSGTAGDVGRTISIGNAHVGAHAILVTAQTAVSVVLLVGAGLLIRSFTDLSRVDPGFDPDRLLTATVSLSASRYWEPDDIVAFYGQLIDEVEGVPGVVSVAAGSALPFVGGITGLPAGAAIEGVGPGRPTEAGPFSPSAVTPGYFQTMGIPLLAGRDFSTADRRDDWSNEWWESGNPVAIVSRSLADRDFPGDDPLGKRLNGSLVIGVVGDVLAGQLDQPNEPPAWVYSPLYQRGWEAELVARVEDDPMALAPAIRDRIASLDPGQPVTLVTMDRAIANTTAPERFATALMALLGGLALLLVTSGIFGVVSYSVSRRTREFGVRCALGANGTGLAWAVVGEGLALSSLGIVLGVAGALTMGRLISSQLHGVRPTDPPTYAIVAVLLLAMSAVGSYVPALCAARVDPSEALRSD